MSRTNRAVSGATVLVLQGLLAAVTPFVVSPILLRLEGRETIGQFSIVTQILSYILLLDLGITQALARELAQLSYQEGTKSERDQSIVTGVAFLSVVGVAAAAALTIVAFTLHLWMSDSESSLKGVRTALLIYAVWMPLRFPSTIVATLIYSGQMVAQYAAIATVSDVFRSLAIIAAVASGLGLSGIAIATVLAEALSALISLYVGRSIVRRVSWATMPSASIGRRLASIGLPLGLMSLADRLTFYSQSIVVGALFDSRAAAAFYASRAPANSGMTLLWRTLDSFVPGLNDLYGRRLLAEFRSAYLRLAGYAVGAASWFGLMVLIFNQAIVRIWLGSEFYLGWMMTVSLGLLAPISTFKNISTKALVVEGGRVRNYMVVILFEGVINIVLSAKLGRRFGPAGVMAAIIGAHLVSITYLYRQAMRVTGQRFVRFTLTLTRRTLRCALPGSVAGLLAVTVFGLDDIRHILLVMTFAGVFGVLGIIILGLEARDRGALLAMIGRILPKSESL